MKYQANPVIVDAFKITFIWQQGERLILQLDDGSSFSPNNEMLTRIVPSIGDYLVVQKDGYQYLNPKDVFLRKYSKIEDF